MQDGVIIVAAWAVVAAVAFVMWTTIGPERDAAPEAAAFGALERTVGTLNAQVLLVILLLVLVLTGYRYAKTQERRERADAAGKPQN